MDLVDIVTNYLKEKGYDGLYVPGECGCKIGDLMPCGQPNTDCEAGYIQAGKRFEETDFLIGPLKANF